jgi:hypothetical protein
MSGIATKWSVLQQQAAAADDLDANGAVRTEVLASWIDEACRAYLAQCAVLEEIRSRDELELRCRLDELPAGALPGRPTALVVSATATEVWPDAFAISVRIRPSDGSSEQPLNVVCRVCLEDATGTPAELGNAVRDELIALEHTARHYN